MIRDNFHSTIQFRESKPATRVHLVNHFVDLIYRTLHGSRVFRGRDPNRFNLFHVRAGKLRSFNLRRWGGLISDMCSRPGEPPRKLNEKIRFYKSGAGGRQREAAQGSIISE